MSFSFPDLQVLLDRGALYASLRQALVGEMLTEKLGDYTWDVDLGPGKMKFASQSDPLLTVETGAELIASVAPGPRSLMWARALPIGAREAGEKVLGAGRAENLPSILADEVAVPVSGDNVDAAVAEAAGQIAAVTTAILGGGVVIAFETGGGTQAVLSLGDLDYARPGIDEKFPMRVPLVLGSETIVDKRAAVHGLATYSQWYIEWTPDWSVASLTDPVAKSTARIEFDGAGRLSSLTGSLTG